MISEGGCGRLSPGIGDISYVKDLQTEEIATTKFRCSQFTSYHSKFDGYGWVGFSLFFSLVRCPSFSIMSGLHEVQFVTGHVKHLF